MNKMTIEIKNGVFTRQWTKGVNTKIFKDYKILDYIENFDTQAMFYYLDTKGNLVLNKELSISKKFTNLKKNITNLILELATEKENNGYLFNYNGLTLLQSCTSRDKELVMGKAVSIAIQKSNISSILPSTEGFFKWFGLRDVITKEPRVVLLNNLMFLDLVNKGVEFVEKISLTTAKTLAELEKLKTIEELEHFNYELYFSIFLKEQGV